MTEWLPHKCQGRAHSKQQSGLDARSDKAQQGAALNRNKHAPSAPSTSQTHENIHILLPVPR